MNIGDAYGWYGKVPCLGDFVRAGLSPQFIQAWDEWLQTLMLSGRETLREGWQECYLTAPIWRFALPAGICGPRGAAGIVMPSVDRVGRQFPFCLVHETEAPAWAAFQSLMPVYSELEEAALAMLDDDASLTSLEETLKKLPRPETPAAEPLKRVDSAIALMTDREPEQVLAAVGGLEPAAIWVASFDRKNHVLLTPQMPSGPAIARALFDLKAPLWTNRD